jgi:hypothetical protein
LAVATVILAGAGFFVQHPGISTWIADRIKAFASLLTLGLVPLFGMVMGNGKGGGKKEGASESLLGLDEPFVNAEEKAESSLPDNFSRFTNYSDFAGALDALELYRGTPKTLSFVGKTGSKKTRDDEIYKDEIITQGTILRGRSRIPIEVSSGAYKIETLSDPLLSPGAEELKVYSYGADGPEEVVGYEFFATTRGSDSGTLYLKTHDRDVVEAIHAQVVSEIEKTGSVAAALDWLVNRSPYPVDLFEISDAGREEWARRALEKNRYFSDRTEFESALAALEGKPGLFPTLIFFDEEFGARSHQMVSRGKISQEGALIPLDVSTHHMGEGVRPPRRFMFSPPDRGRKAST